MSAGPGQVIPKVSKDLSLLAPKFRAAVQAAIIDCNRAGLEAAVYEAYRSDELQKLYYARGRTILPPTRPVTNAPTNQFSWHGYGLAVDVVHQTKFWEPAGGEAWFKKVAVIFKKHGCAWGGEWSNPDTPHFQWAFCKPSPSDMARELLAMRGVEGVWKAVQAIA